MLTDKTHHTQYAVTYDPDHEEVDLHLAAPGVDVRVSLSGDALVDTIAALRHTGQVAVPDYDHDGNPSGDTVHLKVTRRREDTVLEVVRSAGASRWHGTFAYTPPSVGEMFTLFGDAFKEARSVSA